MNKSIKKIIIVFSLLAGVFTTVNFALAAGLTLNDLTGSHNVFGGLGSVDPRIIAARVIQIFLGFLGIIALGLIIYGGFLWMTAGGNEDRVDQAKKVLVSAFIGLLIILSSFGIVTFLLNNLLLSTQGGSGGGGGGGGPSGGIGGAGVIGACSVEIVYPTPNQKDVPRNTSVIITFKEAIDPLTVCQSLDASGLCNGSLVKTSNVQIYKTKDGPAGLLADMQVFGTSDQKTFVFVPRAYLGSPSENLWYTAYFANGIYKPDGHSIFENCQGSYLEWQFEVSNKIDLTPPQVKNNGVFPPPDNGKDTPLASLPVRAAGSVTVNSQPKVYKEATSTSIIVGSGSPSVNVMVDENSTQNGILTLAVNPDGVTAVLSRGTVNLGAAVFNNQTVDFPGVLSLTALSSVAAGSFWLITVTPVQQADTLTVGKMIYVFVSSSVAPNQIAVGGTTAATAQNISTAINTQTEVSASTVGSKVNILARRAEAEGNKIALSSNNITAFTIIPMSGGSDGASGATVVDKPDQPRNAVVRVSFNEPIMPTMVVGSASNVASVIRIVNADAGAKGTGAACTADAECQSFTCAGGLCTGTNNYLNGKFTIANQYQTVEFTSDNQCGVNGCGEPIYCLPENSHLRVELQAASLATCSSNNDCLAKSPYNVCDTYCRKTTGGEIYPQANILSLNGITDATFNSLDGNRDSFTQGPVSFYNQNSPVPSAGDNFSWSFFINNKIDATAPIIETTNPILNATTQVNNVLEITFSKLMMVSTLRTGATDISNGQTTVTHKNINIWSLSNQAVGYWIGSEDVLDVNGIPIKTKAIIGHSDFSEAVSFRAQVGSAVRDIYQNCLKPSVGPGGACPSGVDNTNPSCCSGVPTATLGSDGNCP